MFLRNFAERAAINNIFHRIHGVVCILEVGHIKQKSNENELKNNESHECNQTVYVCQANGYIWSGKQVNRLFVIVNMMMDWTF